MNGWLVLTTHKDAKQNKKELMGRKVDNCNTYSGHVWRCWFDFRDTRKESVRCIAKSSHAVTNTGPA